MNQKQKTALSQLCFDLAKAHLAIGSGGILITIPAPLTKLILILVNAILGLVLILLGMHILEETL